MKCDFFNFFCIVCAIITILGDKCWCKTSMSIYNYFTCDYEVAMATFSEVKNCVCECNIIVNVVTHVIKGNKHEIRE